MPKKTKNRKNRNFNGGGLSGRFTRKVKREVKRELTRIEGIERYAKKNYDYSQHYFRFTDPDNIYEKFKPFIKRKVMNECQMKDIIYMESAILRNDIENEMKHYKDWMTDRGSNDDYLTLSLHEKNEEEETKGEVPYVDEFHPENLIFIKEYNAQPFIKSFLTKLKNIIEKKDQEIFNDMIEYYKGELEIQMGE